MRDGVGHRLQRRTRHDATVEVNQSGYAAHRG
jgi:hypothetical protein